MAGYIGSQTPVVSNGSQRKYTFTATAAQTVFTGMDIPNPQQIQVFQNGVRLVITTDYTVSSGTTVTLVNAASAGDSLVVILFADYQLLDTDALTFTGGTTIEGGLTVDKDGATVLTVDRATSDGTIIDVQKGGTSVGGIGVSASDDFYIGASTASHAGVYFGTDIVYPMRANSLSDGVTSIGHSSNRFNNLYLSGGVYLGGTGAANYLDDYEYGTYTVAITTSSSGTVTLNSSYDDASYVKVGNVVHVQGALDVLSASSPTGYFNISLPFAAKNSNPVQAYRSVGSVTVYNTVSANISDFSTILIQGESQFRVYLGDASSLQQDSAQQLNNGSSARIAFQVTYRTA